MKTNMETGTNLPTSSPPKSTIGILGWLKQNLFNNWYNSILTILSVLVLYFALKGTLTWVFTTAQWDIVADNFRLFMVGQFPVEEIWRIWLALSLVSLLFGLSAGIWRGTNLHLSVVLMGIYLIHILASFTSVNTKMWLGINIAILVVSFFTGPRIPKHKVVTILGWFLAFPITIFLVNGFGVLPEVSTNLWGGLLLTLLISIIAIVFAFPIGILLALGRTSKLPIIRYFCIFFIEFVRGIPLITVLFMAMLLLPLFLPEGIEINNVLRVMVACTLFTSAYMAENVRGGLQSIPNGQYEAAKAIGLNPIQSMTFIIMPQALRAVIPAIVGQSISMFKDTSLVAIVGLADILGIAQAVKSNPDYLGRIMEAYLFVALAYWVIAYSMSYASRRLEKQLGVGER
ncbi:amino acid ABC transporter permease [Aquibacillus koreensis]|uniref:Amino acid ABC transporter permease n=1 Tax=Aquibacillus koreensis TaxID=279446 RepID=A0A9X3WIP1_9BACI|nr:amino acid ABC transporter permease [Aquibacillus koreensis]MCT2534253.1 amino acid ABC transporter permease [Aquibacillus koreensis]MDC3420702.1 amino acid ABC transporter permease [Aquibacillus koreensis]